MKIAVFYYTQSGQALEAVRNICRPLEDAGDRVIYKQIIPLEHYPFPWSAELFWDTFPETRFGMPPSGIESIDFSDIKDADLVIIVGQSWFLSPSLPLQSFFTDPSSKAYLNGRQVVFVNACRNMWLMTSRKVKAYLRDAGAKLVGQIILQDEHRNLVSVVTIVRWLLHGRKAATRFFPAAGISESNLRGASCFGKAIKATFNDNDMEHLQDRLLAVGAIHYKPVVLFMEKAGHRMFGFWASFIRRKGGFRDERRRFRLKLFSIYLHTVLFVVSPFGQIFFYLTYPLHHVGRHRKEDCGIE